MIRIENRMYNTIQEAIDSIPENSDKEVIVHISNGLYKEVVCIEKPHVTLLGESKEHTIISMDRGAKEILEDGMKRGTFRTYTMLVLGDSTTLKNLTIENTAGVGEIAGQAIALYVEADEVLVEECRLLANQDTLFTGPLPPKEIEKNGFIGPTQFRERRNGRQLYRNTYIEGEVDFIFGSATAYFEGCTLFSKNVHKECNGYVTAPSTPVGQEYGYVFNHCRFLSDCPKETVYLGRPWREYAKCAVINSFIDSHIHAEGWHDWNKEKAHSTSFFCESHNEGPGAKGKREPWVHMDVEERDYSIEKVLGNGEKALFPMK